MNPKVAAAGIVLLLVVAMIILAPSWQTGAPEGAWGELTAGDPAASARNLVLNGDFAQPGMAGWSQSKRVESQPHWIPDGEAAPGFGRNGTAGLHIGPASGRRAQAWAAFPIADVRHHDFYFDGYVKMDVRKGRAWAGVEFVLEGKDGQPVASYLAWKGNAGAAKPVREKGLVEEMAQAGDGWYRVPTRTTRDLKAKGLALPEQAFGMTVRLWIDLDDAEVDAAFDDVEVRDMKAGR